MERNSSVIETHRAVKFTNLLSTKVNERGSSVYRESCSLESWELDNFLMSDMNWCRYKTNKDSDKFGVWINMEMRMIRMLSGSYLYNIWSYSDSIFNLELCHLQGLYKDFGGFIEPQAGVFPMTAYVIFDGKRGIIKDKIFDTDRGWVYKVQLNEGDEWLEESDLEPVLR